MFSHTKRFPVLLLTGVVAAGYSTSSGHGQDSGTPGKTAAFRSIQTATRAAPTTFYSDYVGPYDSYWSGQADIVNNMLAPQPNSIQRERVLQAKIDTRRKQVDETLYERAVLPTQEDDRERQRIERVRRSRNDATLTEIWSGDALNVLLDAIQKQQAQHIRRADIPLEPDVVRHLNVTSGAQGGGSIGILRDSGKISWPLVLRRGAYGANRDKVDQAAYNAYRQAESGPVDADLLEALTKGIDALSAQLKENVSDIPPSDYIAAKHFLNDLEGTAKVLQDPKVSNYLTGKWSAKGNTVAELCTNMARQGLRFAPATNNDEEAYVAVQRAMMAYVAPPDRSWDPLAK